MRDGARTKAQTSGRPANACRIIGRSPHTRHLINEIARVAPHDASVLVTGPSGTGKELVARDLHDLSSRREGLFIPVDCALLSGELMASQLFGHVAGAFTGASHAALGCFRAADKGTLFLDEIGEMPLMLQAKLLRAIQERAIAPVGDHVPVAVDVRIIAATNRDLMHETQIGGFREDLYYRLNVVNIQTTPLVDRPQDIAPLADHFLKKLADDGHPQKRLTPGALFALESFAWPGNVRQLRNVLEQAAIESEHELIGQPLVEQLLAAASCHGAGNFRTPVNAHAELERRHGVVPESSGLADWETLAEHEKSHLIATLERTYYNRSATARLLGISRQSLLRRMERHGIAVPDLPGKTKS